MADRQSISNSDIVAPVETLLSEIKEANRGKQKMPVTILGAGISGLVAAFEFTKLGHEVTILEGSERIGGRIHTHYFPDGQYGELGAMRIPDSQDYTLHYIDEMGLTKGRFYNHVPQNLYDAMGLVRPISKAQDIYDSFDLSPADRELVKSGGVGAVYTRYLHRIIDSTSDEVLASLFDLPLGNSKKYVGRNEIDGISLLNYLQQHADTAQRFDVEHPETRQVYSLGAIEMIGVLMSMEDLWETSLTMRIRATVNEEGSVLWTIAGGMSKLPESLGTALTDITGSDRIRCGQKITGIAIDPSSGDVSLNITDQTTGRDTQEVAKHVLCTIPFGVLRKTELAGISQGKLRAIRAMNYCSSTKVLLHCYDRFWESQYGIFGGASKSQGISRQTYYPNDHHPQHFETFSGSRQRLDVHAGGHPEDFSEDANLGISPDSNPGVLLACYSWGWNARRLGGMSHEERVKAVTNSVKSFHPEIEEYVDANASMVWDNHPWALGAYAHPNPNDLAYYLPDAIRAEGSCHFAGEHLSIAPGWIQGAIWSSLKNVLAMVRSFPDN